jgi:putative ABC transport system substrate-binding protein
MTTKTFCRMFFLAGAGIAGLAAGPLQKPGIGHIAIVMEGRNIRLQPQLNGLRDGLEELKYVEGSNLHWLQVNGATQEEVRANLRLLLIRQRIDVLVTVGTAETVVAKELAPNIPLVFLPAADPVRSGFVRSLASPDANLTGLSFFMGSESVGKQLEVFKQVVPSLREVGVIFDGRLKSPDGIERLNRLAAVASWLGIQLIKLPVASTDEASSKLGLLLNAPGAGIFALCSGLFKDLEGLAALAIKRKLPLFGCNAFQVAEQNVMLSYAPDLYSLGYRGAWFVDRIFKGAKPQDLPVETPRKFELVINNKAAAEIGLKIPAEMLMLADRVFR